MNYEAEFVDRNRAALIQRVIAVMPIADELKNKIHDETYAEIKEERTNPSKMRKLFDALNAGGDRVKADFYYALRNNEPYLFKDLGGVTDKSDEADVNMERGILQ